jgi:two-component system chemotaxis response regulator CheY
MSQTILLVGHCGVDGPRLQTELSTNLPDVQVTRVNSTGDLNRCCDEGPDLLLVNREPVGFDEDGLDIVRKVRQAHPECKVMLVSDYPEAQQEAVTAGALPGFGKSQMGSRKLTETVKQALQN